MGIVFPWFIQLMVRLMGTTPKGMVNRKQWKPFIFIHIHCSTFEIDDFGFGDYLASRLFLDGSRHGEYSLFWSIAHGVLCRMWTVDTNMSWQYGGTQHSHPRGDKFKWPKTNTYKYSEPKPLENQSNHSSMPPCHLHQVWHSNLTPATSDLSKQHPLQGIGPSPTVQGIDPSDLKKAHVEGALRPRPDRVMILMTEETLAMNQPWEKESELGWNEWPGDGTTKVGRICTKWSTTNTCNNDSEYR